MATAAASEINLPPLRIVPGAPGFLRRVRVARRHSAPAGYGPLIDVPDRCPRSARSMPPETLPFKRPFKHVAQLLMQRAAQRASPAAGTPRPEPPFSGLAPPPIGGSGGPIDPAVGSTSSAGSRPPMAPLRRRPDAPPAPPSGFWAPAPRPLPFPHTGESPNSACARAVVDAMTDYSSLAADLSEQPMRGRRRGL